MFPMARATTAISQVGAIAHEVCRLNDHRESAVSMRSDGLLSCSTALIFRIHIQANLGAIGSAGEVKST